VIRALKALSAKEDLDEYLDTEEIIRYFAVHNFLATYDSYTGLMLHMTACDSRPEKGT